MDGHERPTIHQATRRPFFFQCAEMNRPPLLDHRRHHACWLSTLRPSTRRRDTAPSQPADRLITDAAIRAASPANDDVRRYRQVNDQDLGDQLAAPWVATALRNTSATDRRQTASREHRRRRCSMLTFGERAGLGSNRRGCGDEHLPGATLILDDSRGRRCFIRVRGNERGGGSDHGGAPATDVVIDRRAVPTISSAIFASRAAAPQFR